MTWLKALVKKMRGTTEIEAEIARLESNISDLELRIVALEYDVSQPAVKSESWRNACL